MNTFFRKITLPLSICIFLFLCYPISPLSAQKEITQKQIDTLLTVNKQKTKIIHINGGWCRVCYQMLPFVDYLNQHKEPHIEITVIFTHALKSKSGHKILLHWLKERGININYYVMDAKQYQQSNLYDNIPTTYVVGSDAAMYRFVGSTDLHKKNILHLIQKDIPKTIEAVDALYKKRKEALRKVITYEGKKYVLKYSDAFTLQGSKGGYNTQIKSYEGDVFKIRATGKIKIGAAAVYITPEGLPNGQFKAHNMIESVNHGKLLAFLYDDNWKRVQGLHIGTSAIFMAKTSGKLILEINDKDYQNNQGYFEGELERYELVQD